LLKGEGQGQTPALYSQLKGNNMPIIQVKGELPKRVELDVYPTPIEYTRAVLKFLQLSHYPIESYEYTLRILDPGAGSGIWGQAVKELYPHAELHGTELRDVPPPPHYDHWHIGKYELLPDTVGKFDLIVGNPPYYVLEDFMDKSFELLHDYGMLSFLLPASFSESKKRYLKYFSKQDYYKPTMIINSVRRISFTGDGKSNATAYAQYTWVKHEKINGDPVPTYWLDWEYDKD
jgi:hypothetical protein